MANAFDPYRDWLGIAPGERPLDHYRLLGLPKFESDAERIAAAADERMALVRSFQVGPRKVHTQRLLNELSAARICLLSPTSRAAYDAALRGAGIPPAYFQAAEAPPIQPPPPPESKVTIVSGEQPIDFENLTPPGPWWRPLASMILAALIVLAAAAAWGVFQSTRSKVAAPTVALPPASLPEEMEPEPPPEAIVQMQEASGEVSLSPATAVLAGGVELRSSGTRELLAGFSLPDAAARWQFRLVAPGFFELELQYATAREVETATLVAAIDEASKPLALRPTEGRDQFHTDTFTMALPKSGLHSLVLRPREALAGEGLILKSVRLVPIKGAGGDERQLDGGRDVDGERGASAP
jgi:hypothetical protein